MGSDNLQAQLKKYRMSQPEYEQACQLVGRPLQGLEWALFSALWSEHCSYKSSKVHLKNLFTKSDRVLESFGENAGVIDLGQGERIAFKIESHNHPSFIEPYQGAATGVGGILRDIFTMGARPIALANYLCFGEPSAPRMKSIVDGVVRGIGGYGNCVGVATVTGQTEFHSSYNQNVLVNAMAVGLFRPGQKVFVSREARPGCIVVYVGAKTGRDGVHGASMASESFSEGSAKQRPSVQIGDPFYEKLLIEACLETMEQGLVESLQDMGAAGLTSSSFEMASKAGVGLKLHLDKVPLRDSTMSPEDIMLSESQERMLYMCHPDKLDELTKVFAKWNLDASPIGEVTLGPNVEIYWHGDLLTSIDPSILVDNAPMYQRPYHEKQNALNGEPTSWTSIEKNPKAQLQESLQSVQGTSRKWISRQYDCHVGALTSRGTEDSVAVQILPDSGRMLATVLGCRPHLMRVDAYLGGIDAVAYPALELAVKGFTPLAVTDCLNYGNPEKIDVMSDFVASLKGINQICEQLEAPIISGNVSFYNETLGNNITPTPAIGLMGLREFTESLPTSSFHQGGEKIYLLQLSGVRTGGVLQENASGKAQAKGQLDPIKIGQFAKKLTTLSRYFKSSRVVGKFGVAYALARMCNEGIGAQVDISEGLFEERLYEVLVSVDVSQASEFVKALSGTEYSEIGTTGNTFLKIGSKLQIDLTQLHTSYEQGWEKHFEV